jgi:hypothetical protein
LCDTFTFSFCFFSLLHRRRRRKKKDCAHEENTGKYEKKNDITTRTRMLIVISDGWPFLLSIKNSSHQSSSNVCEYTRIQEKERQKRSERYANVKHT